MHTHNDIYIYNVYMLYGYRYRYRCMYTYIYIYIYTYIHVFKAARSATCNVTRSSVKRRSPAQLTKRRLTRNAPHKISRSKSS